MEFNALAVQLVSAAAIFNGVAFFVALRSRSAWIRKVDEARDSYRGIVGDLAGQIGNLEAALDQKDDTIARLVAQRDASTQEAFDLRCIRGRLTDEVQWAKRDEKSAEERLDAMKTHMFTLSQAQRVIDAWNQANPTRPFVSLQGLLAGAYVHGSRGRLTRLIPKSTEAPHG